ncbi:hypothetical protein Tamer19_52240 [Cupriavidus sp. TA19]|nr:hypothetical protein Tamer19_52240 [Cupriavidus sp. TA19]
MGNCLRIVQSLGSDLDGTNTHSRLRHSFQNRSPQLKADAGFRDLQSQLEGTENRIAVARNRYIQSVQAYNVTVRSFPSNLTAMALGYKEKPNFTVASESTIAKPPRVEFGAAPASAPGSAK